MGVFQRIADRAGSALRGLLGRAPAPGSIYLRAPRDVSRWPQWLSSGLTIERMSSILRQADQGYVSDYFQLVQEIAAREALVQGLLSVRCAALSQRPIEWQPAEGKHVDKVLAQEAADYTQEIFDTLRLSRTVNGSPEYFGGSKTLVEQLALAAFYGVRVFWTTWTVPTGEPRPRPTSIEILDERRLWHDIQTNTLYLATAESPSRGLNLSEIDPALCIVARYPRISPHLAMAGTARAILLPWWIRFGSYKDFASYLETWSKPSLLATSPKDAPASYDEDNLETVQNLMEDFMGDTRAILPSGFALEVIEAVKGGELVFESADSITERHLQFALVGQVGAIAGDATTYAAGSQAQRVRDDLTDGDAVFVSEVLERIASPALAVEYGAACPLPRCSFGLEESVEATKARALAISTAAYPLTSMLKSGLPIDIDQYCKDNKIPLRADGRMDPRWLNALQEVSRALVGGSPDVPPGAPTEPGAAPEGGAPPSAGPAAPPATERPPETPTLATFGRDHNGVMVALYPSPEVQQALALPGGEPPDEIHLTLCYLGSASEYPYQKSLEACVADWARHQPSLSGEVQGAGVWGEPGSYCLWAAVDVAGLAEARVSLMDLLRKHGLPAAQEHDFSPHITLAYSDTRPKILPEVPHVPLYFDRVCLAVGGVKTWYPFEP